jgi:hypothetical protein
MFSGIVFYLFPRGKLSIFCFRLGCFFVTRVYFSNIPIGVLQLFVFVSFIAKISFILFVSYVVKQHPGQIMS